MAAYLPGLPHGIPSHDTLRRVFAQLDASGFEEGFRAWVKEAFALTDGQSIRGSHDRGRGPPPLCQALQWSSALSQMPVCAVRLCGASRKQVGPPRGLGGRHRFLPSTVPVDVEADRQRVRLRRQVCASVPVVLDLTRPHRAAKRAQHTPAR